MAYSTVGMPVQYHLARPCRDARRVLACSLHLSAQPYFWWVYYSLISSNLFLRWAPPPPPAGPCLPFWIRFLMIHISYTHMDLGLVWYLYRRKYKALNSVYRAQCWMFRLQKCYVCHFSESNHTSHCEIRLVISYLKRKMYLYPHLWFSSLSSFFFLNSSLYSAWWLLLDNCTTSLGWGFLD